MSSTNRSDARSNHIADYYVTPVNKIIDFLHEFDKCDDIFKNDILVLDPCAGGDEDNEMSYPKALKTLNSNLNVDTCDIREDSRSKIKGDYLELECENKYDVIITNPPFNISLDIINKALSDVKEGGYVIMLLRLNYFGGKVRKELFENHMPKYCFVHRRRMSFTANGKTDSIEYCHMVWKKGEFPEFTMLKVIN